MGSPMVRFACEPVESSGLRIKVARPRESNSRPSGSQQAVVKIQMACLVSLTISGTSSNPHNDTQRDLELDSWSNSRPIDRGRFAGWMELWTKSQSRLTVRSEHRHGDIAPKTTPRRNHYAFDGGILAADVRNHDRRHLGAEIGDVRKRQLRIARFINARENYFVVVLWCPHDSVFVPGIDRWDSKADPGS